MVCLECVMVDLVRFYDRIHSVDTPNYDRVQSICTIDDAFHPNALAVLHSKMPIKERILLMQHIHHSIIVMRIPDHICHNRPAHLDAIHGSLSSSTLAGRVEFHVRTFVMAASKNSRTNSVYARVNCDNRYR